MGTHRHDLVGGRPERCLPAGPYSASKGGVIALTKSVALDYAAKGITVNTSSVVIDTPMLASNSEPTNFRRPRC